MSYPNRLLAATLAVALLGALMLLSPEGYAGTVVGDRPAVTERRDAAAPSAPLYQLRCWQHGRLLFEEREVELSGDVVAGVKVRGTDRYRRPLLLSDTGNATCLIRSLPAGAR